MTPTLKILQLGKLHISWVTPSQGGSTEREIESLRTTKTQALLCYLVATKQVHSRDALADLFWNEDTQEKARNSLRVALSNLNKILPNHLDVTRESVAFLKSSPHQLDVDEFAAKTHAVLDSNLPPDVEEMRAALALYRGDFLEDFYISGAPDFEAWLLTEREKWRATALDVWELLAETLLEQRRYAEAAHALEQLLAVEPWHEEAHRNLMITYSRMGDFNAALAQYETCRLALENELDVEPMPETTALYERIQTARRTRPHKLPVDSTPFLGRTVELDQIANLIGNPHVRLLTIVGFGGMGKTRLALTASHQVTQEQAILFLNGVIFVPLAAIEDASALPITLVDALDVPLSGRARPDTELVNYLRNKEMLLVLDNFEHLMAGVPLLNQILEQCPAVKLLVTSREPLGLSAEWRLDLQGLDYPLSADDKLEEHSAVQLFVQTAQQVRPDFQLDAHNAMHIRRLCEITAGMPLALKLAATWLRAMPIARIVAEVERDMDILSTRMRDIPPRQRNMRAVFDYTWALLNEQEQSTFAALAIFRGGFFEEAAKHVADATPAILAGLQDRGLVEVKAVGLNVRYELHDLTQRYAASRLRLDPARESAVQQRHCEYYTQFVHLRSQTLHCEDSRETLQQITLELDNIRATWRCLLSTRRYAALLPLVDPMYTFFFRQGWFSEGTDMFKLAIETLEAESETEPNRQHLLAELMIYQGDLYLWQGQIGQGVTRLERGLELTREYGESVSTARALTVLAWQASGVSAYQRMGELAQEALALYEQFEEPEGRALALHYAGTADFYAQRYRAAEEKFLESIQTCRRHKLHFRLPHALNNLAIMLNGLGRYAEAKAYAQEAVDIISRVHNRAILLYPLLQLGRAELALGNLESAHEHLSRSLTLCREIDDQIRLANVLEALADWAMLTGNDAEARRMLEESLQINRRLGSERFIAIDLNILGLLDQKNGDFEAAVEKHRESYRLFAQLGHESGMATALAYQGRAALARGERQAAETFLVDALQLAGSAHATPTVMSILCDWAAYLCESGQHGAVRRLLAFIRTQEAASYETRQRADNIEQALETESATAETAHSEDAMDLSIAHLLKEFLPEADQQALG